MVAWPLEKVTPSALVADDNQAWREALQDVLAREGIRTVQAECGEEAIEVVRAERIDIVLLDFHMPRLDGLQTLRIIRSENHWTPAVMVTAEPEEVPREEAESLHVWDVLPKSADRRAIVATVVRVVWWR